MFEGTEKNSVLQGPYIISKPDPFWAAISIPLGKTRTESSNERNKNGEGINGKSWNDKEKGSPF
jgi:hypothetical protein